MKEKISPRQTAILIFLSIISMKFLFMPATMTKFAGLDIYLSVAFGLLCDLITLTIYFVVSRKYPNMTLYDIMSRVFGKIFTKILYICISIVFFIKCLFIIKAMHHYMLDTLFDKFSYVLYAVPIAILIFYVLSKNLVTLARCCEIFLIVIILAIIACLAIPLQSVELINLFPILRSGIVSIPKGYFYCMYGFGDYMLLSLLLGHIDYSRSKGGGIIIAAVSGIITVISYFVIFVGVFGKMGVAQDLALSDLSIHAQLPNTLGRLDWLIIFMWSFTLVLGCVMYAFYAKKALIIATSDRFDKVYSWGIIISIIVCMLLLYRDIDLILRIVTSLYFIIPIMCVYYGVPLLLLIAIIVNRIRGGSYATNTKKVVDI